MQIKNMIEKIVEDGNEDEMRELSFILESVMKFVKEYDSEKYKEYEMYLYKMAYGDNFTVEMAQEIVSNMQPYGEHWKIEQTKQIQNEYSMQDINPIDFYIVMNSAYNDYKELFRDNLEMYVVYSQLFIEDEDAKKDKVFLYFTKIPE